MKALVLSDSHTCFGAMCDAVEENPGISLIIHAGDVQRDVEDLMNMYPNIPCAYVLGNNDFGVYDVPYDRFFEFGGKKIFLTHGHKYGVKSSPHRVVAEAKKLGADICIFGHTHQKYLDKGDMMVLNPGSATRSYAIITIEGENVSAELKER